MGRQTKLSSISIRLIQKIYWIFCLTVIGHSLSWAGISDTDADTLALALNRLKSTEDRKSAVEQLKTAQNPKVIEGLFQIIKNPKEPVSLRAYTMETLIQMDKTEITPELKKIVEEASLNAEIRKSALHALWKQDPAAISSELIRWSKNSNETPEIRVAAIDYLGYTDAKQPSLDFWQELLSRQNPASVRIACINSMEQLGLLAGDTMILLALIRDTENKEELRKFSVITAGRLISRAELEEEFMSILSNPKDSFAMKLFAIDNLSAQPNPALAMRIKSLIQKEQLLDIRRELERLAIKLKTPATA